MDDRELHEAFYKRQDESTRLEREPRGVLEKLRTWSVLRSALPHSGLVYDVGGGSGVHASWLAKQGYEVELFDPIGHHVDQARAAAVELPDSIGFGVEQADGRSVPREDATADAVLLLGPLYHLHSYEDRHKTLTEAHRLLKPGGCIVAAGISRFAWLMDAYRQRLTEDVAIQASIANSLRTGHSTPTPSAGSFWAYFHRPEDLQAEIGAAGFDQTTTVALEGFAWMLPDLGDILDSDTRSNDLLRHLQTTESEPSIIGASAHFVVTAKKPIDT